MATPFVDILQSLKEAEVDLALNETKSFSPSR